MGNVFGLKITCSDVVIIRCLDCIGARCEYVIELQRNLERLDESTKKLQSLKNDMVEKIDTTERQGRKRLDQVQEWLDSVDRQVEKVTTLMTNSEHHIEKLCIGGCCSTNCVSSYKFGKKVVRRKRDLDRLETQGKNFTEVAQVTLPEPMVKIPCDLTVGLEQNLDIVCGYLLEDEEHVGIVGLYGESGVGKTALLKQVNNRICSETSRFDLVIPPVTGSNPITLENIQNHIARKIGFYGDEWMSKSLQDKATDIYNVLKMKKFVLLLDDISEYIDLVGIGVPRTNCKSKIVVTTTSERICANMEARRKLKVKPLGWEDSWRLFCQKNGENNLNSDPEIYRLAEELVGECDGLPRTLIRWARELACNRITQDWINAVQYFRDPNLGSQERGRVEEMTENHQRGRNEEMTENPVRFEDINDPSVYGSPILDLTIIEMPIDRAGTVREYVKRFKERGGVATISLVTTAVVLTMFGLFRLPYVLVSVRTMSLKLQEQRSQLLNGRGAQ